MMSICKEFEPPNFVEDTMRIPLILAVDDEPFNLDYIEQELEDMQVEVVLANSGQTALDMVKLNPPDLILLDVMMPGMDGFEILGRLKACTDTQNIPVIIISASNDLQSVVRGIALGAEDYLSKPFEPVLLKARVMSSLEKKRLYDIEHLYLRSLEREFDIAREIQMSFLPSELPEIKGWQIAVYFKAAREVSGDFYDAFILPDDNLICVVGDVCGKGVGAALFMTLFRSLIRAACLTDIIFANSGINLYSARKRLSSVVSFTNNYIAQIHADANMFAAVFLGVIDTHSGLLTYINCGSEHPFVIRCNGVISYLGTTGPVLGLIPDAEYSVGECLLNDGDAFLVFTDGVVDANDEKGNLFGYARLSDILEQQQAKASGLVDGILFHLNKFMRGTEQFDDITLLSVKKS